MKKMLTLCLLVTLVWGVQRSKSYIDNGASAPGPHMPAMIFDGAAVLVDSSGNCYSAWTQAQECLSFSATNDGLQFVCRGYNPTGVLNAQQTDGLFSFWVADPAAYNQDYGAARYPNSSATDGPHMSFPVLIDGAWGGMIGEYEEGGWWNSFWATPEDVGPGDINTHKVIAKQMDDGNIVFVGYSDVDEIFYRTMSPDLMTTIASGTISTGYYYWGFDYNGGSGYMFYYDDALNVYYRSTTDGVSWSAQTTYNMQWPNPYTSNLLFWTQCAVTDAGNPILVFDFLDNDDYSTGTYPYLATTFISRTEGQPCVSASTPYTKAWYPTVATSGNTVVVLYHVARASSGVDSLAFQDIVAATSTDGGATFSVYQNLTESLSNRPGLAQLAKRLDLTNGNFFYFYGINADNNHDPIYHAWRDPEGLDVHRWYVGWQELGVEEHNTVVPTKPMLSIGSNPVSNHANISYAVSVKGDVSLKLYDRTGSLVRNLESGYRNAGTYNVSFGTDNLASGTYFVVLNTAAGEISTSLVVVR